jgi:ATP adenylyltransferase
MDKLWAPWRIKYITAKKTRGCIFCQAKSSKKHYVIFKTKHSIAILNTFPYNNGHIMVSPLAHVRRLEQLKDAEALDLLKALNKAKRLLEEALKPQGFNIGINLSETAGAGITGHIHIHIVPRWKGDTNFMPVLFNTKIISQSLNDVYKRLKNARAETD